MTDKRPRVAVVTAGNRGIGLEVCRELGQRGLTVILASRDRERGETAAAKLVTRGLDIRRRQLDTTDPAGVRDPADWLDGELGGADVLVKNAAILLDEDSDIFRIPESAFRDSFETNVMGPLRLCQARVPRMRARRYGRVVNVSSGAGHRILAGGEPRAHLVLVVPGERLAQLTLERLPPPALHGRPGLIPDWPRRSRGRRSSAKCSIRAIQCYAQAVLALAHFV